MLLSPDGPPGVPAGAGGEASVRLPLFPSGGGRLRAALPSTMTLAEGRWAVYLALGEGVPRRLRSGHHDLRSLVDRRPGVQGDWLGVRIPCADRGDALSLRSWLRRPHAEATDLQHGGTYLEVRGRLYGAPLTRSARLAARPRGTGPPPSGGAPEATISGAAVVRDGGDFRCRLPYRALTGPGDWDLWLCASRGENPVRVARILDGIADKHRTVSHPRHRIGTRTVTPYWTDANDLGLRLEEYGGGREV